MDFHNFDIVYVFKVEESNGDISTDLRCLRDLENPSQLPYWWFSLKNFWNFHTIHVFEVRESIADISTELPCLSNLENLGRHSVQDVLGGTGECVFYIFEISCLFVFLGSRNPLLIFLQSYLVWVTSKI